MVGHLPEFSKINKHQILEQWAQEVGDVYRINLLGKKFIVTANTAINREILRQRPSTFRRYFKMAEIMEEMGIIGVFNAEGDTWKNHRLIVSEALNRRNVERFFPTVSKIANRLLNKWQHMANNGVIIDVQKDMVRYTVDITSEIAFGYPMNTLEKGEDVIQNHMEKIFPMINSRITAPLPTWRWIKSKKDREFDHAIQEVKTFVHELIDQTKQRLDKEPDSKENPNNFLEALLTEQSLEGKLTDKEVFGNVFTMLLAGEDTTSNSLSWAVYFLAQHPEIVNKIRAEAIAIYGNDPIPPTYEKAIALKYTDAVVQETLRIKPVTPQLYLTALKDVEIDGYLFKKGESLITQNKVAQTDANNFIRPEEFMPERWISNGCPVHGGEHKPDTVKTFGGGSRLCPGKGLAVSEMLITLSTLCKNFNFELIGNPEDVQEVFMFTMYPEGLKVKLKAV